MCRQSCDGCPLWPDSLEGMLAKEGTGIVELSVVGALGVDLGMERGAEAIIYREDQQYASARADTPREALRLAQERCRVAGPD